MNACGLRSDVWPRVLAADPLRDSPCHSVDDAFSRVVDYENLCHLVSFRYGWQENHRQTGKDRIWHSIRCQL